MTKIIIILSLFYTILISVIFNFYIDTITDYEERLSSTNNKIVGISYLKLLHNFSIDFLDMQDKQKITSSLIVDIEELNKFNSEHTLFIDKEFNNYLKQITETHGNKIDDAFYYECLNYINYLNYKVGSRAGILFTKEKKHYFLASLLTHYLPEFLVSVGISHNILEDLIKTKDITNDRVNTFIEENKLIYLSTEELQGIIDLMDDSLIVHKLFDTISKIRVNLDKLEKNKRDLLVINYNATYLNENLETLHQLIDKGNKLNSLITENLSALLQSDKINFEDKLIKYKALVLLIVLLISILFIYLFRIFISNVKKDEKLKKLNEDLVSSIKTEVEKNREKDKQLMQQSKLAQMGEMISMIAHQWRQPLAAISSTSVGLELKAILGKADPDFVIEQAKNISKYSQHLSSTIDDFRDFFKSDKKRVKTSYTELINSVLSIVEMSLINKNITVLKELNTEDEFYTYPNELKQVILNLIKNAEDILLDNNVKDPYIKIATAKIGSQYMLSVSDNAGGVPEDIIDKVFNPYFSTKLEKNGSGLGLYMSKTIIQDHCNGSLSIANNEFGAVFTIVLYANEA